MDEVNKNAIIPNGTVLFKDGERFEVTAFSATYHLKELDRVNIGSRRLLIPADHMSEFSISGENLKTYEELARENVQLRNRVAELTDQVHTGFGGHS